MGNCCGEGKTILLWPCSGGADVAEIADRASRKLSKEGFGTMSCLAGIGAGISGFIESAKGADENITIDGCPIACARKNLENIGLKPKAFIITEMGFEKFKTEVNEENIKTACDFVRSGEKASTTKNPKNTGDGCCSCGGQC